ncbi:MAG: ribulose-bisphosphate carboxylase large subunit [Candidatus Diapherotrites archaeon]|nr:ribulose-bisphosphate carboxylase large subunit [Candidatus Diapherotrites archaeon]
MRYEDYVDTRHKPSRSEMTCDFYAEGVRGVKPKWLAGGIAAESSTGTWTELTTEKPYMKKLAARVYKIKKSGRGMDISIAYPPELFEENNMPNILSSVAGNIYGLKEVRYLRMNGLRLPKKLAKSFKGPKFGIKGVQKTFGKKTPLVGTIVKPKLGLRTADHAKVAYEAWVGGCDVVKDDENLSGQSFNRAKKRIETTVKYKRRAEKETGERKGYMFNVTAETFEMLKRTNMAADLRNEYVMIDILTEGWGALQTLRDHSRGRIIHAHRAGHAAITKLPYHGMSMPVICTISRTIGVDQLHVGTAVGKMGEDKREVLENIAACKEKYHGIRPVMPVASGGLNPLHVPALYKIFGNEVIIQMGGGIHGHPWGTRAGAKAARDALDAVVQGRSIRNYSKELDEAIRKWG